MRLITETTQENFEEALIISKATHSPVIDELTNALEKYHIVVKKHLALPKNTSSLSYLFIFYDHRHQEPIQYMNLENTKTAIITHDKQAFHHIFELLEKKQIRNIKVINIDPEEGVKESVDKLLWFITRPSNEIGIDLERSIKTSPVKVHVPFSFHLSRKKIILFIVIIFLAIELFFLFPMSIAGYYLYSAGHHLQNGESGRAKLELKHSEPYLTLSKNSYQLSRPMFLLFFLSLLPDNIIRIEEDLHTFISSGLSASELSHELSHLLVKENKTPDEIQQTKNIINKLRSSVQLLNETASDIKDLLTAHIPKIQEAQKTFESITEYTATAQGLLKHLDTVLGSDGEKNYIIFFYNNMELRPGGGFIGSFAHAQFKNYSLTQFKIYDVYDADGQLTTHVEPPRAIRVYMQQPHWFLRDSNFNPDFEKNVQTAEFFIRKELNIDNFDGAAGITSTALSYILEAFGDVYIPDYDQTINKDNFYIVTQTQAEASFFPGSAQKKTFLSSVGQTLFLKLEEASPQALGKAIKKSLDEKHIVVFNKDAKIQNTFNELRWNGKVVIPECLTATGCLINYILPLDANLGVNKANFFVDRSIELESNLHDDGGVNNTLSIKYNNTSPGEIYPGGTYHNYFQVYLPENASISEVSLDGRKITDYDISTTNYFKVIGLFFDVKPQQERILSITYDLKSKISSGNSTYQVVVQKQIGALNDNFNFKVSFPDTYILTNQNFTSVAKKNQVVYNSSLSTDRVFLLEFLKQ